jgi:nucleoside-diphosphate-sugar epimerase
MAHLFTGRLPIVTMRPFNYTGPGQREPYLVPKLVRHAAQRADVIELGNIYPERDFLDVRVVIDAYARLLRTEAAFGQTFNLCSGVGTSVRGLLEKLEAITGHRMEVRVNPAFVRPNEPARIVGSAQKLRAIIGPLLDVPLTRTLEDMLAEAA